MSIVCGDEAFPRETLQENDSWCFLFISIALILKSAAVKFIHFRRCLQRAAVHSGPYQVCIVSGQAVFHPQVAFLALF